MNSITLKECIELLIDYRGKTPLKLGGDWQEKGIRVISAKNVHNGFLTDENAIRCVNEEIYSKWMKTPIKKGDSFIVSEGATLGESMFWDSDEQIVLGQRLYAVRTNPKILDPKFFGQYIQSDLYKKEIFSRSTGSTVFGISQPSLLDTRLLLPDINTQKKIGEFLYNIDKSIIECKKYQKESRILLEKIYNYWFVQFDFPNEENKPYLSSNGLMINNAQVNSEIPNGWEIKKISDLVSLTKGISYSSEDIKSGDGIPMINLASIDINRDYKTNSLKFYSGKKIDKFVEPRDMLLACTDLTRNADILGSPIIVPNISNKYTYTADLAKINISNNYKDYEYYIYLSLRTNHYHNYIKGYASGTNVIHLDTNGVLNYHIVLPTKEIVKKFNTIIKPIIESDLELINELDRLESLKASISPLLLSGQAKIKEVV